MTLASHLVLERERKLSENDGILSLSKDFKTCDFRSLSSK